MRASLNPKALAALTKVAEINAMPRSPAKNTALEAWKHEGGEEVEMGACNFYPLSDLKTFNCRVRVIMDPAEQADPAAMKD